MKYNIYPLPQTIEYGSKEVVLTETIQIVNQEEQANHSLVKLKSGLEKLGKSYQVGTSVEKGMSSLSFVCDASYEAQKYSLEIDAEDEARITIKGKDDTSLFYGVMTFLQILKNAEKGKLATCKIEDYPEITYRGYIEGFYGYPWSHEDRLDLMVFAGEQKLNTYIYAPKDDPYHRKSWRDLYPEDKAKQITELAKEGAKNNVNFVWTIHPGDSIDLNSEEDFESALHKMEQLYLLGVRQFGILFDDIVGVPDGKGQAEFINRVDDKFVKAKGDIAPLITVGTRYCEAWGPSMEGYFKDFVTSLHEDVEVMWTGAATMSNISRKQYQVPKDKIGSDKNLSVWWNYPVNDYCDAKLLMGKIENLSTDLDNVNGFFVNPMNQAQASKQAMFCIADHNWNTHSFDCNHSYTASFYALDEVIGKELGIVASNLCYLKDDGGDSGVFYFDESWDWKEDITAILESLREETLDANKIENLRNRFLQLREAITVIKEKGTNKQLLSELDPFMAALEELSLAGLKLLEAMNSYLIGDLKSMEENQIEAKHHVEASETKKVPRLKDNVPREFPVEVGTLMIKPFLLESHQLLSEVAKTCSPMPENHLIEENIALASKGVTVTVSSGKEKEEEAEKLIEGNIKSGKWCTGEVHPWITLDLQEPKTIHQYKMINCGHPEAGETKMWNTREAKLLFSLDGQNFQVADELVDNEESEVNRMLYDPVQAQYVRLEIVHPTQLSIEGEGFTRIYGLELFDKPCPPLSRAFSLDEILVDQDGVTVKFLDKGDEVFFYDSIDSTNPILSISCMENREEYRIDSDKLKGLSRIFVERKARHYLPSIRSSRSC